MSLLDALKTNDELKEYLDSLTKHVLAAEKRMYVLEAKLNEVQEILERPRKDED